MTDYRSLTVRERLDRFPPFLCLALSRVKSEPESLCDKAKRLWNRRERERRRRLKMKGIVIPRKSEWRRLTLRELSDRAHIDLASVSRLASQRDWNHCGVFTMLRYLDACGIDLLHVERHHRFMRNGIEKNRAFSHLTPDQMRRFTRLARKWKNPVDNSDSVE